MRKVTSAILVMFPLLLVSCAGSKAVVQKDRDEASYHYQIGVAHLRNSSYGDAMIELTKAVELDPQNAPYHDALGLVYGARGMNDKAAEHFVRATVIDPSYSEAYMNLGALRLSEREWDKSIEATRMVLRNVFYKTPELAHNNIGWALFNKGDLSGALESFKRAADLNPRYAMAYNNMGLTYERMNLIDEAVKAYNTAISRSPRFADAYYNLGHLLARNNDRPGAVKAFEKVLELDPRGSYGMMARERIEQIERGR